MRQSPDFDKLDRDVQLEILSHKCLKYESHLESLREVCIRKKLKRNYTYRYCTNVVATGAHGFGTEEADNVSGRRHLVWIVHASSRSAGGLR